MSNLIVVKQIPVIEERLKSIRPEIEEKVSRALSFACTEETYKDIKKIRAELAKEKAELESQRKQVKAAVMAPYEQFEKLYKEHIGNIYDDADRQLKEKISAVENGIKAEREAELMEFFNEYRESLELDDHFAPYSESGIKVGMSDSRKALHLKATQYLDGVREDITAINGMEDSAEVMVEYLVCHSVSRAVSIVKARHELAEEERKRKEILDSKKESVKEQNDTMVEKVENVVESAPKIEIEEPEYEATFKVVATLEKLKKLKQYLDVEGFNYESV